MSRPSRGHLPGSPGSKCRQSGVQAPAARGPSARSSGSKRRQPRGLTGRSPGVSPAGAAVCDRPERPPRRAKIKGLMDSYRVTFVRGRTVDGLNDWLNHRPGSFNRIGWPHSLIRSLLAIIFYVYGSDLHCAVISIIRSLNQHVEHGYNNHINNDRG